MVAREQWPSRTSFILASIGSAIGLGNILRYPSVVWANWGLQWFIPYIFALFSIGIPLLLLEIALGQTFKSTNVVGFGRINHRLRGLGLGSIVNAYIVATYYNIIISWCIIYFVRSFESPLPWAENPSRFLTDEIIANVGSTWIESKGNIIWNTWIWSALIWICIFFSLFKGVNLLGKIVYVTLGIPFLMLIVLVTRGITLENASRGIHYYVGVWRLEVLGEPSIWQDAVGQIFFSIGAGFGVFTTYASYNPIFQDSVVDALIIGLSNSAFEVIAAFSTFGVVGFLDLVPGKDTLGTFILGFITYPTALAQMEFANLSSVLFFVMLFFLGIDSSFSLVEPIITLFEDSKVIGARFKRSTICIWFTIFGILCAFIYSLDVGATFLNYVDRYTNSIRH
jgi:solute carrier family 6 (neurotransmitter transporter, GABA) member 1